MKQIVRKPITLTTTQLGTLWARPDVMVLATGSLPCVRGAYIRARKAKKLHQFRYVCIQEMDYVLGTAEDKIAESIKEIATIEGVEVIVLYLSCPDILIRVDFSYLENIVSKEVGKPVKCFFRGPLSKGKKVEREEVKTFLADLPLPVKSINENQKVIPPPIPDCAALAEFFDEDKTARLVVNPMGCTVCMSESDTIKDGNLFGTQCYEDAHTFGAESTVAKDIDVLSDTSCEDIVLLPTAIPSLMGFHEELVRSTVSSPKKMKMLKSNGFLDAMVGNSQYELELAKRIRFVEGKSDIKKAILFGDSPLLAGKEESFLPAMKYLRERGYVVERFFDNVEELRENDLLCVVTAAGISAAKLLQHKYHLPCLFGLPQSVEIYEAWRIHCDEFLTSSQSAFWIHEQLLYRQMNVKGDDEQCVLLLGEPLQMLELKLLLEVRGISHVQIGAWCWSSETKKIYKQCIKGDDLVFFSSLEELRHHPANLVVGDPLILNGFTEKNTVSLPWGFLSGRSAIRKSALYLGSEKFLEKLNKNLI